jgi:hypothetical protein
MIEHLHFRVQRLQFIYISKTRGGSCIRNLFGLCQPSPEQEWCQRGSELIQFVLLTLEPHCVNCLCWYCLCLSIHLPAIHGQMHGLALAICMSYHTCLYTTLLSGSNPTMKFLPLTLGMFSLIAIASTQEMAQSNIRSSVNFSCGFSFHLQGT